MLPGTLESLIAKYWRVSWNCIGKGSNQARIAADLLEIARGLENEISARRATREYALNLRSLAREIETSRGRIGAQRLSRAHLGCCRNRAAKVTSMALGVAVRDPLSVEITQ